MHKNKYVHHINGVNLVSVLILIKSLGHWQTISQSLLDKENDILLCNWKWHLISVMYTFSEVSYLSLFLVLCIFSTCRETKASKVLMPASVLLFLYFQFHVSFSSRAVASQGKKFKPRRNFSHTYNLCM